MKRIANRDAREYVQTKTPFKGSHLTGDWEKHPAGMFFVVRSYDWWVLLAYHEPMEVWYENTQYHSVTTRKHLTQAHPLHPTIVTDAVTIIQALKQGATAITLRKEEA